MQFGVPLFFAPVVDLERPPTGARQKIAKIERYFHGFLAFSFASYRKPFFGMLNLDPKMGWF
jgi:hypothetical protein